MHGIVDTAMGLAVVSLGIGTLMVLKKSKKHYIGVMWDDGGKNGGLALQAYESDYGGVLARLAGFIGQKAVDSDTKAVRI